MKTINETWTDVVGYENYYIVSNYGNVKSLDRTITRKNGTTQFIKGRVLTKRLNDDGYETVKLSKNDISKRVFVHTLVAQAFIPNPYALPEINHKDFKRDNNAVANLEWCSHEYNVHYSYKHGHYFHDIYGVNNRNYNNHTLSHKYKNDRVLSKEKQSRPHGQNGRAKSVSMYDINFNFLYRFDWIDGCVEFLKNNNIVTGKTKTIHSRIVHSAKTGKSYLNYYFTF